MTQAVIAQTSSPGAATWTGLYTVPTGRRARIIVSASNRSNSTASEVRIALSPAGAAIADAQWIFVDDLAALSTVEKVLIVTATDVVRVYSTNATVSFVGNGLEEDIPT